MRTQKQIAASRENGGKSHGANLQTGIFAETQVLMWEHPEELQELEDEYYAQHPPASPEARCLLDQIVMCEWHLRRFDWVEGSLWDKLSTASPQNFDGCAYALQQGDQTFTRLQHRINSFMGHAESRSRSLHQARAARSAAWRLGCRVP
jgi:hypothetical protein